MNREGSALRAIGRFHSTDPWQPEDRVVTDDQVGAGGERDHEREHGGKQPGDPAPPGEDGDAEQDEEERQAHVVVDAPRPTWPE